MLLGTLITLLFSSCLTNLAWANDEDPNSVDLLNTADAAIQWKKQTASLSHDEQLLASASTEAAESGSRANDWLALALGRLGYPDDYAAYRALIESNVARLYADERNLSTTNPTDWHRSGIAVLSLGGDPATLTAQSTSFIADGTYYREGLQPLRAQGTSAYIWGLILLDSLRYEIPAEANLDRDALITHLLEMQESDGGFGFGNSSSADLTGMALQALAPYYNSEQVYAYTRSSDGAALEGSARNAVDRALAYLSDTQQPNGGFGKESGAYCESVAQAIIGLCSLGISPTKDERFIKEGNTLVGALLSYVQEDGGFSHELDGDSPGGVTGGGNASSGNIVSSPIATDQALLSLAALVRQQEGARTLYDFRIEQDAALKAQIAQLEEEIAGLATAESSAYSDHIQSLLSKYLTIPVGERSYVANYTVLSDALAARGLENNSEWLAGSMGENSSGNGYVLDLYGLAGVTAGERLADAGNDSQGSKAQDSPLPLNGIIAAGAVVALLAVLVIIIMRKRKAGGSNAKQIK